MLSISNLYTLPFSVEIFSLSRSFNLQLPPISMASLRIVAEYAKSNRSSCKKCAKPIIVGALRLGLVSRDSRGFDMTKWHHLNCFKMASSLDSIPSVDEIGGFTNLAVCLRMQLLISNIFGCFVLNFNLFHISGE